MCSLLSSRKEERKRGEGVLSMHALLTRLQDVFGNFSLLEIGARHARRHLGNILEAG